MVSPAMIREPGAPATQKVVEKYFMMRIQAHQNRHQAARREWMTARPNDETGYFAAFRAEVERTKDWYERQIVSINENQAMGWGDRQNALRTASERLVLPAWSGEAPGVDCGQERPSCSHRECAFLRTYGDPRSNTLAMQMMLVMHQAPKWPMEPRGTDDPTERPKSPWELTWYDALTNPQDGSIPMSAEYVPTQVIVPSEFTAGPDVTVTAEIDLVPAPETEPVPQLTEMQAKLIERQCGWCGDVFKSKAGKGSHQRNCKDKPEPPIESPSALAGTV